MSAVSLPCDRLLFLFSFFSPFLSLCDSVWLFLFCLLCKATVLGLNVLVGFNVIGFAFHASM
ncbi:hypothetical protein QBC45DRAFT_426171 [Copromyces sp. CBS 386.78]|nr:hypothetical protein QBC45DRAFT_426171 [Copromyces sp. CBS 386.78]